MDRQTLSIMKACEVVGVSRRTIYNWISAGKVEYVRTAGGSIRIFADTLWRDAAPAARAEDSAAALRLHLVLTRESSGRLLMDDPAAGLQPSRTRNCGVLFHRLNNQLGIILAHAEMLEARAADDAEPRTSDAARRGGAGGHGPRPSHPPAHAMSPACERARSRHGVRCVRPPAPAPFRSTRNCNCSVKSLTNAVSAPPRA